ncbi:class I SAM-dependent methyltransferase [Maritalea mediterranea]|uniref:Class I SAM-dependent methyltransferase n=1 Tax=Maritalea mediterranea TaxID=2909667 RepID=A0ABS9EAV1_9HYPH|nr:class I SAM-dependent methyltransferase [Maritalea mediterranea]MCF4100016.1 class I SAM-dependent methyltransferase [Maritalea mediterranea]
MTTDKANLAELAAQTAEIYERNAAKFVSQRPKALVEAPWLDRFLKLLPPNPAILDLGCGAGQPIGAYLLAQGAQVTGLDVSPSMIAMAQQNLIQGVWHVADMRAMDIPEKFDGIIGWNSFFHLTKTEQRALLPQLAAHLKPKGALLLTVGPDEGEVVGQVGDDPIYHASLSPDEYRDRLAACGMSVVDFVSEDPDCYDMTLLLAQK